MSIEEPKMSQTDPVSEKTQSVFESAWKKLSDDEKKIITYIHFHFSGEDEHKLPNQDELEKSAKEKLLQDGIDVENLENYLEDKNELPK